MNNSIELAQDRFIEKINNMCDKFGLNGFVARLFAVLYLNNGPLSLDDLEKRLKASKGNVSINIRELERMGAVRKIWIKGSRKDFYEAELNIKKVFANKLKSAIQKQISEVSEMTAEFNNAVALNYEELTEEDKGVAKSCKERLKKIEELNELLSTLLIFIDKIL